MKSSLTMTLTPDFNPAIKMHCEQDINDDLRDRVFSVFRERLGFVSSWCTIEFGREYIDNKTLFIEPISPEGIVDEILRMEDALKTDMPEYYKELTLKRAAQGDFFPKE